MIDVLCACDCVHFTYIHILVFTIFIGLIQLTAASDLKLLMSDWKSVRNINQNNSVTIFVHFSLFVIFFPEDVVRHFGHFCAD